MATTLTYAVDLGWGCTDYHRAQYIPQDQDSDAQAFADYLAADSQQAREDISRQLARRGCLTGTMAVAR